MSNAWLPKTIALIAVIASAALWLQLSDAQKQIAARDAKISSLTNANNQYQAQASRDAQDIRQKRALIEEKNADITEASKPELGVIGGFFKPDTDVLGNSDESGYVARLENIEGKSIEITVTPRRPSTGETTKPFTFYLDQGQTARLGEKDGWAFLNGDELTVNEAGHKSGKMICNNT